MAIEEMNKEELISVKKTSHHGIWDSFVESYIHFIGFVFKKYHKKEEIVDNFVKKIPEPSAFFMHFTFVFLIFSVLLFFSSCMSPTSTFEERRWGSEKSYLTESLFSNNKTAKKDDKVYIRREQMQIIPKSPSSITGSMWADNNKPMQYIADYKPHSIGDIVTFTVPKDLQYTYPEKEKDTIKPTLRSIEFTDQMETLDTSSFEPVKTVKMEIVEIDPTGNTYLRGEKQFVGVDGQPRNLLLLGKIPTRDLTQFTMSVEAINQIAISDLLRTGLVNYSAPGWDLTTSRILSGYVPDIQAELDDVYQRKNALNAERKALQDMQKSLKREKEQLLKERERMANLEQARFQENESLENKQIEEKPVSNTSNEISNGKSQNSKNGIFEN